MPNSMDIFSDERSRPYEIILSDAFVRDMLWDGPCYRPSSRQERNWNPTSYKNKPAQKLAVKKRRAANKRASKQRRRA